MRVQEELNGVIRTARSAKHVGENRMADKKVDLAGPGIGDYDELERILPEDYKCLLTPKETQRAVFALKNYIEHRFSR